MNTGAHRCSRAARERVTADGPSVLAMGLAAALAAAGRAGDFEVAAASPFGVRDFRDFFAFFRGLLPSAAMPNSDAAAIPQLLADAQNSQAPIFFLRSPPLSP